MEAGTQFRDDLAVTGVELLLALCPPHVVEMASTARDERQIALEATRRWKVLRLLAHVPLAGHVGVIAGILGEAPQRARRARSDIPRSQAFLSDWRL